MKGCGKWSGTYRVASTAVTEDSTISPDVGPIFGASGFLDFYVNGELSWGVELLREGEGMPNGLMRGGYMKNFLSSNGGCKNQNKAFGMCRMTMISAGTTPIQSFYFSIHVNPKLHRSLGVFDGLEGDVKATPKMGLFGGPCYDVERSVWSVSHVVDNDGRITYHE